MYVVIIGCGRVGSALAKELSNEGHDVSVIDSENERLKALGSGFNGQRLRGVEYDQGILIEAGIKEADVFVAVTPDDNTNITASQIARDIFKVPRVIGRTSEPEKGYIYELLGIETINPTKQAAYYLKNKILNKDLEIIASLDEYIDIVRIVVSNNRYTRVKEIEEKYQCSISAIRRSMEFIVPTRDLEIRKFDQIVCAIRKTDRRRLTAALCQEV